MEHEELLRTIRLRNEQRVKEIERLDAEIKAQNEALGKKSRATSPADVESTAKDTLRRGIHNKTEKLSELKESLVQCSVKLIKTDPLQCEAMLQEELATTAHQFREAHSHLKRKIAQETASATRYENMLEEQNHIAEALAEIRTSLEEGNMQPQPSWKGLDLKGEISSFLRKYFPDQAANTAESTVGCDSHSKKQRGESADCSMEKLVFELLERFPGSIIIDPAIHSQTHIEMLVHCGAVEFTPDRKKSIRLTDMGC